MKYLLNTRTDWNEPPRARHQLAYALAKKHEVVFITINKSGKPNINIFRTNNITVIEPIWYIHGRFGCRIPLVNELYQFWLFKRLFKKYRDYKVINFDHTATSIYWWFRDVVFYCNDDYVALDHSKSIFVSPYWYLTQNRVASKAQFCIGVSKYLHKKLLRMNPNSNMILTGAPSIDKAGNTNERKEHKKSTKEIVYIGWLGKLNRMWIIQLVKRKEFKIFLIGPYKKKEVQSYLSYNNIILTGPKIGEELYQYMRRADVYIAPYKQGKYTERGYTMPNKFWLYLSFGKPIVTCQIKNLVDLPRGFVYQSENISKFISNIDKAVSEDSPDIFEKRIQFILQNTWDNRVDELLGLYKKYAVS